MTVKAFYSGTYTPDTQVYYWLVNKDGRDLMITRRRAAEIQNDPSLPYGWTVERRMVTKMVAACPWCGARPVQWEMDCDGWASTGTCGSKQCNRLRRCEGCGTDGTARIGSVRGHLCLSCNETARQNNLEAARDRYELVPSTW
jgi:hypothetical protein